jgi:nucleoside-triphosphatase THEP1
MTRATDKIAAVVGANGAITQSLFAALVAEWRASGAKIAGIIAEPHGPSDRSCTAGVLRDITSGATYQIHLDTPPVGTSCEIDAGGVESACAAVLKALPACDLVILSKFGKLETMHAGLAAAFEAAITAHKPVLTTVSDRHRDSWQALAPEAVSLTADEAAIRAWWRDIRGNSGILPA